MHGNITVNAIHQAITSLSTKSAKVLHDLGQTLLAFYAYDNFDVDLKLLIHTAEKSEDTLKHLTSAIVFPFQHGVKQEDMRCSEELWSQSQLNPRVNISDLPMGRTWKDLLTLHPEAKHSSGLTQHTRFNSWKFLWDLCHHGPNYLAQFQANIGDAEVIEQIPIVKTPTIPACAMEFSNSTVSRNISIVKNLTEQGGVGDPNDPETQNEVVDLTPYVILFHSDLGTGDHLLSIQSCHAIEKSAWNQFQFAIFVPGLFHIKMACVDMLWCIFIQPPEGRVDDTCLMRDISKLHPKETGIIASKPGFH